VDENRRAELQAILSKMQVEVQINTALAERNAVLLANLPVLLALVPNHDRSSCSDENAGNLYKCYRCNLLQIQRNMNWPEDCVVMVNVRWRKVSLTPSCGSNED